MSLSSFYNFKVENGWEESHDFKSRVGALEDFQSEYHFEAYVSGERAEEYDFTARFNALDELEAHYHFFAQSLEYDAEYHFTGQIAPLEMEIEYEDEAEMVAVVRVASIAPIIKADAKNMRNATIENIYEIESDDERIAEIERKSVAEKDEDVTIELSNHEIGSMKIKEDAVIHNSFDATLEKHHVVTLEIADAATVDDIVELDVEMSNSADSPTDIHVDISNHLVIDNPSVELVDLERPFELNKENEVDATLEESFKVKGAAIPTDVEQDILAESTSEFNAMLELPQETESVNLHQAEIEQSNELDFIHHAAIAEFEIDLIGKTDTNYLANVESPAEANKLLECTAEIEEYRHADRVNEKATSVEQELFADKSNERYVEIEDWYESVAVIRFTAKIEESLKSDVNVTLNANVVDPLDAEVRNVDIAEVERSNIAEHDVERMAELDDGTNAEIIQELNAEIEESFKVKGAAILTDIEKDIDAVTRNNYDAIVERQNALNPSNTQVRAEIDQSEVAKEALEFDTSIEQGIEFDKSDKHSTQIADIESPQIADEKNDFTADIEVSYESKKKLDGILADIEEFIYSDRVNDNLFAETGDYFDADKTQERMAEIEYDIHADKLQEFIADLEDALDGEIPKKKRDKLIWLIMGRPSWIHQYWQRTTR